jgi:sugar phosphate isomerase/epimerase
MKTQNYEIRDAKIKSAFIKMKNEKPENFERRITLSWSSWIFGIEKFNDTVSRLKKAGLDYLELKGDSHTEDSAGDLVEIKKILKNHDMKISGSVGIFSPENDLSSNSVYSRQNAIDYINRELKRLKELNAAYMIIVPAAVGRPDPLDSSELWRSTESLRSCIETLKKTGVKAAIEPIRSAEVSMVHSIDDAIEYINLVDSEFVQHINGDIYHMLLEEEHIGEAILQAGDRLVNLHLADSNRDGLGRGMIDLDTVIMASYLNGMNQEGRFLTPEPLGPYPVPYDLMNAPCDVEVMDKLVFETIDYFREREEIVRAL